ncbi:MAG: LD-carboxypeptidase [Alphaproteobacteria bacterium]|nr:LD-carboxypeptidase [Alphaproteobacteria bacterium]
MVLQKGDVIGICAPSSWLETESLEKPVSYFESKGYRVKFSENIYSKERFLAGSDEARADALMKLFADDEVKAIFTARGGYGSARILDLLDYDIIRQNKKIFVGFSDSTALQLALLARAGLPSFTGMTVCNDLKTGQLSPLIEESLWNFFQDKPFSINNLTCLKKGKAEGILIGGCLSLVVSLLGTPYMPDVEGAVLLLEDVKEEPYKIDRMLTQLKLAGVFEKVSGVIFGQFKDCTAKDSTDGTVEQVIKETASYINKPVISDIKYGHGADRYVLPIGKKVAIDTDVIYSCH